LINTKLHPLVFYIAKTEVSHRESIVANIRGNVMLADDGLAVED